MPVDPKDYQPKKSDDATMATLLTQMAQMQQETAKLLAEMRQSGTGETGVIEKLLETQQQILVKTRPENNDPPMVSALNPLGDRDHPRPELKCKFIWCGQEEQRDQLTRDEIELRNRLEPGEYRVTKSNGQSIPFRVTPRYTDAGKLEQLEVWFPCKNEHRSEHMPNVSYLRQVLGEHIPSTDELLVQLERMKAELASAKAGVVGVV